MKGWCIIVVLAGAALDLATKAWARATLEPYGSAADFLPFISLRLTFNKGVSFSLLSFEHDGGKLALLVFTGLITLGLATWAWRIPHARERLALSVIIAGALGNFLNRAVDGAVTDYLDLHFGDWHPFVFNLADVWISVGAVMLVVFQAFSKKIEERSAA
ncbi:signal peptidase II [Rhizobium sp. 9140]|uniref:signal peptidase II n=1 Tax=Rhizobium sp. 9140 TaxID=1761900 RepID=UPI0007966F00|nr:signal peptidase II [Rhizobium sp. 9140]CZT38056.1 signal peptidase II [Rhizobium sp. 9140]